MPNVYSTAEVAQLLGLSQRTVQSYITDGKLEAEERRRGLKSVNVVTMEALEAFSTKYRVPILAQEADSPAGDQ